MRGPDFIGVGAPRAGSSWLHEVLSRHPRLWLPPIKELHYFDEPLQSKRYYRYLRMRLIGGFWIRRPFSRFDLHYFLGKRSDSWYCNLFAPARRKGRVVGEITPAYSAISTEALQRMSALNPQVKLIYIMRDPVDRSWSAAVKAHRQRGGSGLPSPVDAIRTARAEGVQLRSSYLESIERFEQVFPQERIFYGFYQQIRETPAALVTSILRFLGVTPGDVDRLLPGMPLNVAAAGRKPPIEFSRALAKDYLPWVEKLSQRFDGPPRAWLEKYEALLGDE
jgi:hypothetical protein